MARQKLRPRRDAHVARIITAKRDGACSRCGTPFQASDVIRWTPWTGETICRGDCAKERSAP